MTESSELANAWIETVDGRSLPLRGNCRLGRKPGSDIIITGANASREHAFIHAQGESEFWLIDLGSTNGTFLNDRRVMRPTRLQDRDRVGIAGAIFCFRQPGEGPVPGGVTTLGAGQATVMDLAQREAWLLIVDIESFIELSRTLPPDQLAVGVGTWIQKGERLVTKSGGRISKFLGDGFLACWDATVDKTRSVVETITGFHELREAGSVKFRVIVHRGVVTFGGAVQFGEENIIGPELNYIFRLEKLAAALGVKFCVSSVARLSLEEHLPLQPVAGEHVLKGFPDRHRCFSIDWP